MTPTRRVVIDWPVTARGLAVALGLDPAAFVVVLAFRLGLPVGETAVLDEDLAVRLAARYGVALEVRRVPPSEDDAKGADRMRGFMTREPE